MQETFEADFYSRIFKNLDAIVSSPNLRPKYAWERQPIQVLYGGANLFRANYVAKMRKISLAYLQEYAGNAVALTQILGCDEVIYERVRQKLEKEPVEDCRIDFEDGYGIRPAEIEDQDAIQAGVEIGKASELPPCLGIRIKPLNLEFRQRAIRTLDLFLTALRQQIPLEKFPKHFVVTLPKVTHPKQVEALADILDEMEKRLGIPNHRIGMELLIETSQGLIQQGKIVVGDLVFASRNRSQAIIFGPYDYMASLRIPSVAQNLHHPTAIQARYLIQSSLEGQSIRLCDGPTTQLPMPLYPTTNELTTEQKQANAKNIHRAWKQAYQNVMTSLENGYYQGFDLHPGQLPCRYAATYQFFLSQWANVVKRLQRFFEQRGQAMATGNTFDDAATIRGLANLAFQAYQCGAVSTDEWTMTGLPLQEILALVQTDSF